MADLSWFAAVRRYGAPRRLETRARRSPFQIVAIGQALIVTPRSGLQRRISRSEYERVVPLLDRASRAELLKVTYNSSYIEAIVADLGRP